MVAAVATWMSTTLRAGTVSLCPLGLCYRLCYILVNYFNPLTANLKGTT